MRYSAMLGHADDSWCSPGFCCAGSAAVPGRAAVWTGRVAGHCGAGVGRQPHDHASVVSRVAAVGRAGRKPRLDRRQWAQVEAALLKGPAAHGFATTLWTLPRIAAVIARRTGVRYHPAHVWRILQGLHWSLQRPARQARERDEAAIGQWRRRRWPQVKKTRGAGTPG